MHLDDQMKIIFLGTGTSTGIPMIGCKCAVCASADPRDNRTRCSLYIEYRGRRIVIDTGPDFRTQMLREGLDDADAILYTHHHKDHVAGLDDVRPINFLKKKSLDLFGNRRTLNRIRIEYPYIFDGSYGGSPSVLLHEVADESFHVGDVEVLPVHVQHGNDAVLAFRIGDFTYITDANHIPEQAFGRIKGSRVLVINALRRERHYSHFTLEEALEVIRIVQPEHAYLVHMSHFLGRHADIVKELPPNVSPAYDGLTLTV